MGLFKRRKNSDSGESYCEDTLMVEFRKTMAWLVELSKSDYEEIKKAMDKDYEAYSLLHKINNSDSPFILHPKEGK